MESIDFEAQRRAYSRRFAKPPGTVTGEWTPRYMSDWWTPLALSNLIPDVQLLVLLRDPIARFLSGFTHAYSRRISSLADAASDAHWRRLYSVHLTRLYCHFQQSQVLVQEFERIVEDPSYEMEKALHFFRP
jgi:hypothetical protein